jgi:hypothetical protein
MSIFDDLSFPGCLTVMSPKIGLIFVAFSSVVDADTARTGVSCHCGESS